MEHRVFWTKNYFQNYRHNIVQYPTVENVLATMLEMNLCFIGTMSVMTTGIWEQAH